MHYEDRIHTLSLGSLIQLGLFLSIICWPANAEPLDNAISVSVELAGDDGLTQSLSHALKEEIKKNSDIAHSKAEVDRNFIITSDSNIDSDTLEGREVMIYRVQLHRGNRLIGAKVGVCYERQPTKCAADIVRQFARIIRVRELRS